MPAISYVDIRHAPRALHDTSLRESWAPAPKRRALGGGRAALVFGDASPSATPSRELPSEVWAQVFAYVAKEDVLENVAAVSRYWRALGLQPSVLMPKLWRPIAVDEGRGRYAPGAKILAQARAETKLVRQVQVQPMVLRPQAGPLRAACFTPDSHTAFVISDDGYCGWRSLVDLRIRRLTPPPWYGVRTLRRAHSAGFSPDARCAFVGSDEGIFVVWPGPHAPHFAQVGNADIKPRFCAAFKHDATHIVTANADDSLAIWGVHALTEPTVVLPRPDLHHASYIACCRWSQSGDTIAGLTAYGQVFVWDLKAPEKSPVQLPTSNVSSVATSHDGKWVAAGYQHGRLRLFAALGAARATACVRPSRGYVRTLTFSPDDTVIAAGDLDGQLTLWRWKLSQGEQPYACLMGHRDAVRAAAFDATGNLVMSASDDGDVRLWPMVSFDTLRPVLDARGAERPLANT